MQPLAPLPYRPLWDHLDQIPGPAGAGIRDLYRTHWDRIRTAPGSAAAHQAWTSPPEPLGGYVGHVTECLNLAAGLYATLTACRPLDFTLADLQIVLALHDIEKPWRYGPAPAAAAQGDKAARSAFRHELLAAHAIELTPLQINGLTYVEGEHDYTPGQRRASPLAALAHSIDMISARLWPDAPLLHDPWPGASVHGRGVRPLSAPVSPSPVP